MASAAISHSRVGTQFIGDSELDFRNKFNRASFPFSHRLSGHPLLELPALVELAKNTPKEDLYFDAGDVRIGQRWDEVPRAGLSVEDLIDRIENAGAWIILRRADKNPEYGAILDQCLAELEELIGIDLRKGMKSRAAIVFITSPNRISAYHIDRECNFLLQVHGDKQISIFDRFDRTVLPEEEIERFWTVDNNAAIYKEQHQDRAVVYDFKPGTGVHIPVNAPHWVKNGNNISVTIAMTFQFHDSALANIYRTNYFLRKVGIVPTPPGRSRIRDTLKSSVMGSAIGVSRLLKSMRGLTRATGTSQEA
jgi:hypothetical protein